MGGRRRRVPIAPQVRGRVTPRVLEHWRSSGWAVHRIGQAAYVHGDGHHLIVGVWGRRDPRPPWAGRLGRASDGYLRRVTRCVAEQRGRRFLRDALGRFVALMPWWRWAPATVYSFEPVGLSLYELELEWARG